MANNLVPGGSKFTYVWNPFQDILGNRITKEVIHCEGPNQPIIIPRCAPFFARDFKIRLKGSTTDLVFENGDYSFVYPYMNFIQNYNNLCYGGVLIHKVSGPTDYEIDYDTIGGQFVLDDVNYASLVGNVLENPRTINFDQIINFPTEFPPDPHDHPAMDTFGYLDMMTWMKSYLDALTGIDTSLTVAQQFADHINQDLQLAHKATLGSLGVKNLKDFPVADVTNIKTESTEVYANIWAVKTLIRQFFNGEWE